MRWTFAHDKHCNLAPEDHESDHHYNFTIYSDDREDYHTVPEATRIVGQVFKLEDAQKICASGSILREFNEMVALAEELESALNGTAQYSILHKLRKQITHMHGSVAFAKQGERIFNPQIKEVGDND